MDRVPFGEPGDHRLLITCLDAKPKVSCGENDLEGWYIMASERGQLQIDRLLDQAEETMSQMNWDERPRP